MFRCHITTGHPSLTPSHPHPHTQCSGKLINPHNPEYITKRPWYLGESGPSLNHHAKQNGDSSLGLQEAEEILARKPKFVGRATTYRKGACENCGAMTHKKKDCLERPRSLSKSAKVSGMDIAPDEAVVDLQVRAVGIGIGVGIVGLWGVVGRWIAHYVFTSHTGVREAELGREARPVGRLPPGRPRAGHRAVRWEW